MTAQRIVVIEDDPAILLGLADNLSAESYDVLTANNGEDGYLLVQESHPDLVILDLMLPRMGGYEICRQMRRGGLTTPVLMLTAQAQETHRVAGFEAGADDYVTKPFSVRELLGRVRAILLRSEGRADLANQRELDEARQIQRRLMPVEIPHIPGCRIAAICRPARIVGGDYFDVLKLDDGAAAVCIADVCGKGMPAAMMMANLQAAVKTCAARGMSPKTLCEAVNRVMCANMAHGFISFFYAVLTPGATRLTYCNAGHNPPLLRRGEAESTEDLLTLSVGGTVLGILRDWDYIEDSISLHPGDRILLYTDGITESRSPGGEEFGEHRLRDLLHASAKSEATALAESVIDTATGFNHGNFDDDLTVVGVSIDD
jgi:serine phosphatase RsbU (regulator of sigma subunit)